MPPRVCAGSKKSGRENNETRKDIDQTAMRELAAYPPDADRIVQRCTERLEGVGWQLIKSCVDKDIAAAKKKD